MGRFLAHAFVALCALAGLACSSPPLGAASSATPLKPFPIKRCVNLGNALEAPREGEWGYRIRMQDLERIKAAGFDGVRLPVRWDVHTGAAPEFAIDPAHFARVDAVVDHALGQGLRVVLDVHHFAPLMDDPHGQEAKLIALWRQIATRYAGRPDALIFEILNEPHGASMRAPVVERLNARALSEIRKTNPTRRVVVGGPRWNSLEGLSGWSPPAGDPNLAVTVHYYRPWEFTHQNAEWLETKPNFGRAWGDARDRAIMTKDMRKIAEWGSANGQAMFVGEFGANIAVPEPQRALWVRAMREALETERLSWCHWDFAGAFSIYDWRTDTWRAPMREALLQ
jgi:endoglucanase